MTPDALQEVRDHKPLVFELARALSLAAHIDVVLVRRLRRALLTRADVTTEADLWSSALVHRRGTEISLRDEVRRALWDELRTDGPALEDAWRELAAARTAARPLLVLEERLTYLALHNDLATIEEELRTVVKAMMDSKDRRRDLAAWSARALAQLPPEVRDTEAAKILGTAASSWVATPASIAGLTPLPENVRLANRLRADDELASVAIRRVGDTLEVGGSPPPPSVRIDLPLASPVVILDEDRTVRIDIHGVTRIAVSRPEVMIGTSDGRRWLLGPEQPVPDRNAIAALSGTQGLGAAYLVSPTLAVTSARHLAAPGTGAWTGVLRFGTVTVSAKAIALDGDADIALLELANPVPFTPLELQTEVNQGEPWQAFPLPATGSANAGPADRAPPRGWRGTVASGWPGVTLAMPVDEVPERLNRPGMPIFRGTQVIAHLRGEPRQDGVLHTTSARLIQWWLAQVTREHPPDSPAPPSPVEGSNLGRIWLISRRSEDVPPEIALQEVPAFARGDYVVLVLGDYGRLWPAALYQVVARERPAAKSKSATEYQQNAPMPAGVEMTADLMMRLSRPSDELMGALFSEIGPLRDPAQQGITQSLATRDRIVEMLWKFHADTPEGEQITAHLGSPRHSQHTLRSVPVLVHMPERISTGGLLGTRLAHDDNGVRRFRAHQWGAHEVTIVTGSEPWQAEPAALKVRIQDQVSEALDREFYPTLFTSTPSKEPFLTACESAAAQFSSDPRVNRDPRSSDFDLELDVYRLPSESRAHACRRGIQFLIIALDAVDVPQAVADLVYLAVPGSGALDLRDAQVAIERETQFRLMSIDPETDVVAVRLPLRQVRGDRNAMHAAVAAALHGALYRVFPAARRADALAWRFGVSDIRGGRRLSVEGGAPSVPSPGKATLTVTAIDDRPVRGYVSFFYSVPAGSDVAQRSQRVRATNGVAQCEVPDPLDGYAVGAIIEDEGVMLETTIAANDPEAQGVSAYAGNDDTADANIGGESEPAPRGESAS